MPDINIRLRLAREERATAFTRLNEINDAAATRDSGFTDEERQEYDRLEARVDQLGGADGQGGDIGRLERQRDRERLDTGDDRGAERRGRMLGGEDPDDGEPRSYESYADFLAGEGRGRVNASAEYRDAFFRLMSGGFSDRAYQHLTDEQRTLMDRARGDNSEDAFGDSRALSALVGAQGGYAVPSTTENRIVERADLSSPLRQLCTVITTASGEVISIPLEASIGAGGWIAENTAYIESDVVLGVAKLAAYKFVTISRLPRELIADSVFDMEEYLVRVLGRRIGQGEGAAYAVGAPADPQNPGMPTGVYGKLTVGVTAAGQGASNAFTAAKPLASDELIDLQESVGQAYQGNARWVLSPGAAKAIRKQKTTDGQYLLVPGLRDGETDGLLGKPVVRDEFLPAPAVGKVMAAYGDFREAITIRDVAGVYVQRLNELYAASGQVGFLADHRSDIGLVNASAVKTLVAPAS